MTRPRVAVIGAGPAGSTAARLLAAHGARVTLFEARRLPRAKLCGGGLTPKAQRLVPPRALATVERRVARAELRGPHLSPVVIDEPEATIAMVERVRFDTALVEAAAEAGVEVRDDEPVREMSEADSSVFVRTDGGRFTADAAVVADGEPSGSARQLGLGGRARRLALALEVDLPFSTAVSPDTAILVYGLPGGYGWYFPKGDHANVGVGTYRSGSAQGLREELQRLGRAMELDIGDGRVRGHWIPQGLRTGALASRRVVLAGDAAAVADSLFGEGISYAILSGVVAAQTIEAWSDGQIGDLLAYDRRLRTVLAPALDRLDLVSRTAERSITVALLAVRLSSFARARALDAIGGRRAPFDIDRHCELACVCELHAATMSAPPSSLAIDRSPHCQRCTELCTA